MMLDVPCSVDLNANFIALDQTFLLQSRNTIYRICRIAFGMLAMALLIFAACLLWMPCSWMFQNLSANILSFCMKTVCLEIWARTLS